MSLMPVSLHIPPVFKPDTATSLELIHAADDTAPLERVCLGKIVEPVVARARFNFFDFTLIELLIEFVSLRVLIQFALIRFLFI